jgi:hypothetical protein
VVELSLLTTGSVRVFDQSGRVVSVLAEKALPAGRHRFEFRAPGAGVYLVRAAGVEQPARLLVVE